MNSDTASVAFALCGTILLSLYLVHTVVCNDDFVMWLAGGDAQVSTIANRVLNQMRRRRRMRDMRETMKRLCMYTQSVIIGIGLGYLVDYDEGNFSISMWELDSSFAIPVLFPTVLMVGIYLHTHHQAVLQDNRNRFRASVIAAAVALVTALLAA